MPYKPQRSCSYPGCATLTDTGKCDLHRHSLSQRAFDARRGSASSRGYDRDWQRVRLQVLKQNPLCVQCAESGIVTAALDVDHIRPITSAPHLRLAVSNLQPLCRACHVKKTRQEQQGS